MLGEMIGELKGKITGQRVTTERGRIETSLQEAGKILGEELSQTVTFWTEPRGGNSGLYGEGAGVMLTRKREMATWSARVLFRPMGDGAMHGFGSMVAETSSTKLERLSGVVILFEVDVDESGNTRAKLWEWK